MGARNRIRGASLTRTLTSARFSTAAGCGSSRSVCSHTILRAKWRGTKSPRSPIPANARSGTASNHTLRGGEDTSECALARKRSGVSITNGVGAPLRRRARAMVETDPVSTPGNEWAAVARSKRVPRGQADAHERKSAVGPDAKRPLPSRRSCDAWLLRRSRSMSSAVKRPKRTLTPSNTASDRP